MKRVRIYPYAMGSKSAKLLAEQLNAKRVLPDGQYVPKENDLIINWGTSLIPKWQAGESKVLNSVNAVNVSASKKASYRIFEQNEIPTVSWTESYQVAISWLREGHIVLARTMDRSHSGRGISVLNPNGEGMLDSTIGDVHRIAMTRGCFFAKYQTHVGEFRLHVVGNKVIDFVKKKKMSEEKRVADVINEYNQYVRNHRFGWVFAREDVVLPDGMAELAIRAISALKLDFGAVDVIYSKKYGMFVLEVNTAPGLEGTTLEKYTAAFKALAI